MKPSPLGANHHDPLFHNNTSSNSNISSSSASLSSSSSSASLMGHKRRHHITRIGSNSFLSGSSSASSLNNNNHNGSNQNLLLPPAYQQQQQHHKSDATFPSPLDGASAAEDSNHHHQDETMASHQQQQLHSHPSSTDSMKPPRIPKPINTGLANRHKNRLFHPPREIAPSVISLQQHYNQLQERNPELHLASSLSRMIHDAIVYYTKVKRIKIISTYELYQTIGTGAFSKVKFAVDTRLQQSQPGHPPKPIACKIISIDSMNAKEMHSYVMREISIMKRLNHDNVVRFHDVVKSENNIYLFVELISSGDLYSRVKLRGKLSEQTSRQYFVQLVRGLEYCHNEEKIAHRDLKPQNILVDETLDREEVLKISDFGLAALVQGGKQKLQSQVGTVYFMCPEIRLGKSYDGFSADVYSLGMILYTMLSGDVLKLTDQQVKEAYQEKDLKIEFPAYMSSEVKHLLSIMLDPNPKTRIALGEVRYHPWCIQEFRKSDEKLRQQKEAQKKKSSTVEETSPDRVDSSQLSSSSSSVSSSTTPLSPVGDVLQIGAATTATKTGSKKRIHNSSSPGRHVSPSVSRKRKPSLRTTSSASRGLTAANFRQRANSDDSKVRPFSSPAGRKRAVSLSKISTTRNKHKQISSSPLTSGDNIGGGSGKKGGKKNIISSSSSSKTCFFVRRRKIKEAVVLVETVLSKMKCFTRSISPSELSVLYRYTDAFEKRVTLKYSIHFSVERLNSSQGQIGVKVEFKHLSGEHFAFKKNFMQVRKDLNGLSAE